MRTRRRFALFAPVVAFALMAAACGGDDSDSDSEDTSAATSAETTAPGTTDASTGTSAATTPGGSGSITVGSADFTESQLLGEIYAQALEAKGFDVSRELNIGARELYYAAIVGGDVDVLPEYTNSLLSFVLRQADPNALPTATDVDGQLSELDEVLPEPLAVLTPSEAEDKDTIVCTQAVAEEHGLTDLSSLFAVADQITIGAPPEFETRAPFGLAGFAEQGATFKEFVPLQFSAIADALNGGSIDCGNLFSTSPVIVSSGFVALTDDLGLVPAEAVLPLIRTDTVDASAQDALDAVSAALTTEGLVQMVAAVENDAEDQAEVASTFLTDNGLS